MRLTLKKGSRRHQIRTKPTIRMNQGVFPSPFPPLPNRLVTTVNHDSMNEVSKSTMNIRNSLIKCTNAHTPIHTEIINGNRIQRTSSKITMSKPATHVMKLKANKFGLGGWTRMSCPPRIRNDTRTTRRKMRLTLKNWGRKNQIRPKPLVRMNQRILPNPIPPPPNSLIPTMDNNCMNEITETTMNIGSSTMKLTNTFTPKHIKITKSNRIQRSNSKNPVPLSSNSTDRARDIPCRIMAFRTSITALNLRLMSSKGEIEESRYKKTSVAS